MPSFCCLQYEKQQKPGVEAWERGTHKPAETLTVIYHNVYACLYTRQQYRLLTVQAGLLGIIQHPLMYQWVGGHHEVVGEEDVAQYRVQVDQDHSQPKRERNGLEITQNTFDYIL